MVPLGVRNPCFDSNKYIKARYDRLHSNFLKKLIQYCQSNFREKQRTKQKKNLQE